MPKLGTERGISEEQYAGWRSEFGHKKEEDLVTAAEKLGLEVLDKKPEKIPSPEEFPASIVRATGADDFEKGIDFYIFNTITKEFMLVDMSVSNDPKVHDKKRNKERTSEVRFLPLKSRTLELASQGSLRDLENIQSSLVELTLSDALDQHRKGKIHLAEDRIKKIEQRLQATQEGY